MPLFETITVQNIHWALNKNLETAFTELAKKVPEVGNARLSVPLAAAGTRVKKIQGVRDLGDRAATSLVP